jgi:eukaryotic-like serine/threonine-protein kinase
MASESALPSPAPRSEEWSGTDRYRIVRRIGEGGMGVVYEAFDREAQQTVALKTLLRYEPAGLYRFKQEFRTLADVSHPNLVRLHELVATEADLVFFTTELVRGTDFLTYVRKGDGHGTSAARSQVLTVHRLSSEKSDVHERRPGARLASDSDNKPSLADPEKLRSALRQLTEGMLALHAAGKLHRDIKPSNVLVTTEGRVVLLDFGVATELTPDKNRFGENEIVGTVAYMAPEQALEQAPTPACDWYSVGVVLFEAIVGKRPFEGAALDVISMKNMVDAPAPSELVDDVPADLDALCRALLERDPDKRPSGSEILRRLGAGRSMRPPRSLLPALDAGRPAMLVGRERELAALRSAFEAACAGRSVTVTLRGESGMGKSAVARHFVDELMERGEAVVLQGRAYERESVPYKAFDSIVDALSRYVMHLYEIGDDLELPADIAPLACVFPVLRRVPSVAEIAEEAVHDPQLVRMRAFAAMRELLAALARRHPLVLCIDDVHWGDLDSASLLLEIIRPPGEPPLLLLMTHREAEAQASPFLMETRAHWPERAEVRNLAVGPLELEGATRLALALLGSDDASSQERAAAIARESAGSPFLIEELARSASGIHSVAHAAGGADSTATLTVEQMVSHRVERLPDNARRLLETIAIGGRPLPVSIVGKACDAGEEVYELVSLLSASRFAHAGMRDGSDVVETSHDRIRETIVARLPATTVRDRHRRLAQALEGYPATDPEALTVHLLGADEKERAMQYAERAAEQAAAKLAFDRAARLFELTLGNVARSSPEARRLRVRLAQMLEWAGRGREAARAYEQAAEGAPPIERAELERAASVELMASGRIDEGAAVLRRVLAAVGLRAPESPLGALFWLIVYSLWIRLIGLHKRAAGTIRPEERAQVDALFAAAMGFAIVDVVLGASMTARHLIAARRAGDRFQLLRATALYASFLSSPGGKPTKLEQGMFDTVTRLADKEESAEGRAFVYGTRGVSLYMRGNWREALARFDDSIEKLQSHSHRAGWQANAHIFSCWALNFLGEYRDLSRRHARFLADAERRGDLYTAVQLRDGSLAIVWLVADNPEGARRSVRESIALWSNTRYLLQHWHAMFGEAEIELYVGNGARAYARIECDMAALRKSFLLNSQHMRAQTAFVRGRAAVASLDAEPQKRDARLDEVRRLAAQLKDEGMAWTAPFAAILTAAAANAEGDRAGAAASLRSAIQLADAASMSGYANAARHQLGILLGRDGGGEGAELVRAAKEALARQGVVVPDRFASTLVPGVWRSPNEPGKEFG